MDPNATLDSIRELTARFESNDGLDEHDSHELASLVIALDEWISRNGFLPQAWQL